MGLLSRNVARRAAPVAIAGVAGAAGALLACRRLRGQAELQAAPVSPPPSAPRPAAVTNPPAPPSTPEPPTPTPAPGPPAPPAPEPVPPTPAPEPGPPAPPTPDPAPPAPAAKPAPAPAEPTAAERELAETVRTALAAPLAAAGGDVEVEVEGETVALRGRVDSPEALRELKRAATEVPGVDRVRVLLHLPGNAAKRR